MNYLISACALSAGFVLSGVGIMAIQDAAHTKQEANVILKEALVSEKEARVHRQAILKMLKIEDKEVNQP